MHQSLLFQDMLWKIKADIFCYHNLGELVRKMSLVKWEQFFLLYLKIILRQKSSQVLDWRRSSQMFLIRKGLLSQVALVNWESHTDYKVYIVV